MTRSNLAALAALHCLLLSACGGGGAENGQPQAQAPPANPPPPAANVTQQRLLNAASEPSQWLTNGGDYQEWRYSGLTHVDRSNVWQLKLADRKSTRLNSSHSQISYAVFCLKKKRTNRSAQKR